MEYDIFTYDLQTAEELSENLGKPFLVDCSCDSSLYQLLDCPEQRLVGLRHLEERRLLIEIRVSSGAHSGDVVWPREDNLTLSQVLTYHLN